VEVDLESADSMKRGVDSVLESFDHIDILINNAGWTMEKPFLILTDEEWDQMISINLTSVARLSRLVMKGMLERKQGAIVNISSTVASAFGRGVSAYASAKAAVNRLTEVLALEMGKKGLRVNTVCPGVIDTPMSEGMIHRLNQHIRERTPMRRIGTVDEVTPAVLFLASEVTASFITGQHIYVNGGVNIGL
jgi:3-oxoacyl-[acyl-carrier protein] reductase